MHHSKFYWLLDRSCGPIFAILPSSRFENWKPKRSSMAKINRTCAILSQPLISAAVVVSERVIGCDGNFALKISCSMPKIGVIEHSLFPTVDEVNRTVIEIQATLLRLFGRRTYLVSYSKSQFLAACSKRGKLYGALEGVSRNVDGGTGAQYSPAPWAVALCMSASSAFLPMTSILPLELIACASMNTMPRFKASAPFKSTMPVCLVHTKA